MSESQITNANSAEYQLGVLRNIKREFRCRKTYNWVFVQKFLLSHTSKGGSTSSINHCIFLGIDPDGYNLEKLK